MKFKKLHLTKTLTSLLAISAIFLAACAPIQPAAPSAQTSESSSEAAATSEEGPIYIGVSGPKTGPLAQYGEQWVKGFDLALDQINGNGGINGRPLEYIFEDTQSDPQQAVAVAQKFVADPNIIVELGDFSSTASMAASQIYQRGELVQFGFTNSHPDFTFAGGDYTWSNSVTQAQASPAQADFAVTDLGLTRLAVFYLNNDWGKSAYDLLAPRVEELGAEIVSTAPYLAEEKDFRSALTAAFDANPDAIILLSYQADGAAIVQQLRQAGSDLPVVGASPIQSPDYLELGGDAVEGTYIIGQFLNSDPRPHVKGVVDAYVAKYNEAPDFFAMHAYDTMILISQVIELGGPTREGVHSALSEIADVPSVIYESASFDPETRRVKDPQFVGLQIVDGEFVLWDGTKPGE